MAKLKTVFICSNCGISSAKWLGKCPSCEEWNTMVEEVVEKEPKHLSSAGWKSYEPDSPMILSTNLEDIGNIPAQRISTGDNELDKAMGGGLVAGSVSLLTGQPGIGKSTLMLQMALNAKVDKVLYVSGEESSEQIKMRADRIKKQRSDCYLLAETKLSSILYEAIRLKVKLLIVDSVQTLFDENLESSPGSITQIRECTHQLIRFAKETGTPLIIIGHINKEGDIAGPKLLEHMVDTVMHFEGDKHHLYRILRIFKNRFGSTDELSMYEMNAEGLRPIENPSELLLAQHDEQLSGSAIAATIEGQRPLLIETQALVSNAVYGVPQRIANGFDSKRMAMLLAVLEKRCGFNLTQKDVFLNLAGGIRISDPSVDLAVVAAVISSLEDKPLHKLLCFAGEVGLSGEIRAVSKIDSRIQEAARIGFKAICISKYNINSRDLSKYKLNVVPVSTIDELYEKVFSK